MAVYRLPRKARNICSRSSFVCRVWAQFNGTGGRDGGAMEWGGRLTAATICHLKPRRLFPPRIRHVFFLSFTVVKSASIDRRSQQSIADGQRGWTEGEKERRGRGRMENEGTGIAEAGGGHNLARGDYRKVHCRLPACQSLSPSLAVSIPLSLSLPLSLAHSIFLYLCLSVSLSDECANNGLHNAKQEINYSACRPSIWMCMCVCVCVLYECECV